MYNYVMKNNIFIIHELLGGGASQTRLRYKPEAVKAGIKKIPTFPPGARVVIPADSRGRPLKNGRRARGVGKTRGARIWDGRVDGRAP